METIASPINSVIRFVRFFVSLKGGRLTTTQIPLASLDEFGFCVERFVRRNTTEDACQGFSVLMCKYCVELHFKIRYSQTRNALCAKLTQRQTKLARQRFGFVFMGAEICTMEYTAVQPLSIVSLSLSFLASLSSSFLPLALTHKQIQKVH